MSRIGKLPVTIPDKVKVDVDDQTIRVEGPKGKIEQTFDAPVQIAVEDGDIIVRPLDQSHRAKAMYGTTRSLISNMVEGVTNGFSKKLEVKGVGFRAAVQGKVINLSLGYSHPINQEIPEGLKVTVTDQTKILIEGVDKQAVGALAAEIKHYYKPEPYKGKGVHIEGEFYRRKEGKKAG
jgi:large subunit ribosomal protein L6